ncbi:hypothetical protein P692DRAFT_20883618 [Suillus brevipes Sb2]|nr:hypothetical protein P692DRAFT_20883618 [Suillus brevipes Sb2]
MKEVSSIKTLTTAARTNPIGNRPPPKVNRNGPIHFPPNTLTVEDDDTMELSNRDHDQEQDKSLSPPDTPTPTPRGEGTPLPDTYRQQTVRKRPLTPSSDEMEDLPDIRIPYLSSPVRDPPPPPPTRNPPLPFAPITTETSDEDGLRAQLEVAETMRTIARSIAPTTTINSQRFTPAPEGGFPVIHLPHAAALLDYVHPSTINAWLAVANPKFLVRVFDYDGKEHETMNAILTQRIRNLVAEIMSEHNLGPV